jgi:hypothetical protein
MSIYYKIISWSDEATGVNDIDAASERGFASIADAARHIRNAADYIIAVENGLPRPLTEEELAFEDVPKKGNLYFRSV